MRLYKVTACLLLHITAPVCGRYYFYPHFIDLLRFRDIIISLSKVDQTNHSNMSFHSEPLSLVPVKWNKNTHFTAHKADVRSQEMIMQMKAVLNEKNLSRCWLAFKKISLLLLLYMMLRVLLLLLSHFSPTLCDPIDGTPPGSPVPGIL